MTPIEINKESGQHKSCLKKKAYPSEIQAAVMAGKQQFYTGTQLRWYHCPWCGKFHITHTNRR